jgi:broad specificity phosphatase PhoE
MSLRSHPSGCSTRYASGLECSTYLMRFLILFAVVACSAFAQNSGTIFIVRHAERESAAKDAPLSDLGRARANCLASTLHRSGITDILTSEFQRTQMTAAPLAESAKLPLATIPAADSSKLAADAKAAAAHGNVLIVAHSNTIPEILALLGTARVAVADDEFDSLFIVTLGTSGNHLATIRYCPSSPR